MSPEIHTPDKWLSFGLAFVGGFGDAAGFVLAKTFTGHITGSMVLGAIVLAAHDGQGFLKHFLAAACFLSGIPLSVVIARLTLRSSWPFLPSALGIEVILIVGAYVALAFHLAGIEIFVVCLSLALGVQNAAFRRTGGISVHTNYLTGTITTLLTSEAEKRAFDTAPRQATIPDPKSSLLFGIWGAFLLGAGTGAAMAFHFKERGILGAAVVLLAIIVRNETVSPRADCAS
jgi:uncharacterized membrane protein YoaK (UPF0700 family)